MPAILFPKTRCNICRNANFVASYPFATQRQNPVSACGCDEQRPIDWRMEQLRKSLPAHFVRAPAATEQHFHFRIDRRRRHALSVLVKIPQAQECYLKNPRAGTFLFLWSGAGVFLPRNATGTMQRWSQAAAPAKSFEFGGGARENHSDQSLRSCRLQRNPFGHETGSALRRVAH